MATISSGSPCFGFSGRVGDLVYRSFGGRTIVSIRPRPSAKPPSAAQRAQRQAFAAAFARRARPDPRMAEPRARVAAATKPPPWVGIDLHPPEVTRIIDTEYEGRAGDSIRIYARDDTAVARVDVMLRTGDGRVVETGTARNRHYFWTYHAKCTVPPGATITIEARVRDLAGNVAVRSQEVRMGE